MNVFSSREWRCVVGWQAVIGLGIVVLALIAGLGAVMVQQGKKLNNLERQQWASKRPVPLRGPFSPAQLGPAPK